MSTLQLTGKLQQRDFGGRALAFDSVVVLSPFHWNYRDDMCQTTHDIALEFSRLWPTLFVEPSVTWNWKSEKFRVGRLAYSLLGSRTKTIGQNLTIFRRRSLPLGRREIVRNFDLTRNARALRRFLRTAGFRRPLLWHSFPYWSEVLIDAINYTQLVYHCLDYSPREEERRLIRNASAVFCVSDTLVRKHSTSNPNTYLFPNGVNLKVFNSVAAKQNARPADLPRNGRLIGFVGSINCHVDVELLVQVANAYPEDHLVLIGPVLSNETALRGSRMREFRRLLEMSNVLALGFRPMRELASYIASFDVCLIPYTSNEFNRERDPLKFYQYLALGKPVVTTPLSLVNRYGDYCYVAESAEEFVCCISSAFSEAHNEDLCRRRIEIAHTHGWSRLVAEACERLSEISATK